MPSVVSNVPFTKVRDPHAPFRPEPMLLAASEPSSSPVKVTLDNPRHSNPDAFTSEDEMVLEPAIEIETVLELTVNGVRFWIETASRST
jgi:hypothetical protein